MNNMQSTNYPQSTDNFSQVPASSVPPQSPPEVATYDDVLDVIDRFLLNNKHMNYEQEHHFNKGLSKPVSSKITAQRLITNINMLVIDHINTHNKDMTHKQKNILNHYLESVSSAGKIIDNIDIQVAGNELLCYIIGYMIKTLKNVNVNAIYDNDQ